MGRVDNKLTANKKLTGEHFETFAVGLIMKELYPGINPTSASHDGGEDAITHPSVTFLNNGKFISVASSKTGTLAKIRQDCEACKNNNRKRDVLVFATTRDVRSDTIENWKVEIRNEFGWDLEVYTIRWFQLIVSKPVHESYIDSFLDVPPPDGDFTSTINDEFLKVSKTDLGNVRVRIPGLNNPIQRVEVDLIEDQLRLGNSVIITGDPGTGKSGLGVMLAQNSTEQNKIVLFFDARRFASFHSESDISNHFHLRGTFSNAVRRAGSHKGCRVIIDQFDSVIGLEISDILAEIASEIATFQGVEVIIITRKKEGHEQDSLNYLNGRGFIEKESYPLNQNQVLEVLKLLNITSTDEMAKISANLLNLEIIGQIKQENPTFDFSNLLNEVDLWLKYIETVRARETRVINTSSADALINEAIRLAKVGLKEPDRDFPLESLSREQKRLESWEIIFKVEGYQYRFRHEKLQDFLYAKDAVSRGWLKDNVLNEIPKYRTINIFRWMQSLYDREKSQKRIQFMKDMLNV